MAFFSDLLGLRRSPSFTKRFSHKSATWDLYRSTRLMVRGTFRSIARRQHCRDKRPSFRHVFAKTSLLALSPGKVSRPPTTVTNLRRFLERRPMTTRCSPAAAFLPGFAIRTCRPEKKHKKRGGGEQNGKEKERVGRAGGGRRREWGEWYNRWSAPSDLNYRQTVVVCFFRSFPPTYTVAGS